jgi:hypothetical protein
MTLRRQVVDLARLVLLDQPDEVGGVGEVAVVHEKLGLVLVRVYIEIVDTPGVKGRRAALDAMDRVSLVQ